MDAHEEPAAEALRRQLRALAERNDLPVPELRVDAPGRQERLPTTRDGAVVVPHSLLEAAPPRQLWHLAACLGRLGSPVPRRRQRIGWALFALAGVAYLALILLARQYPIVWLAIALLYPLGSWTARWERQAMEDAGRRLLAGAGHDPAQVARAAFGDDPEPTPWKHLLSNEPTPRERIDAASRSHP